MKKNYETVINALQEATDYLLNRANSAFGNYLLFDLVSSDYDLARTSYVVRINMFGFYIDFIYDLASGVIVVYDVEHDYTLGQATIDENETEMDLSEMFDAAYHYGMFLHTVDSTCCFD